MRIAEIDTKPVFRFVPVEHGVAFVITGPVGPYGRVILHVVGMRLEVDTDVMRH